MPGQWDDEKPGCTLDRLGAIPRKVVSLLKRAKEDRREEGELLEVDKSALGPEEELRRHKARKRLTAPGTGDISSPSPKLPISSKD